MGNEAAVVSRHDDWWRHLFGSCVRSQHHLREIQFHTHPIASSPEIVRKNKDVQSDFAVSTLALNVYCKHRDPDFCEK